MEFLKDRSLRDIILTHVMFSIVAVIVLLLPLTVGQRMLIIVICYNAMIPLVANLRGHKEWLSIWLFVLPLSILMIFPDWYLATQLDVLAFPDDGFIMIGEIPIYMAGLWAIPLFALTFIGCEAKKRYSFTRTLLVVALLTLFVFIMAEETMWMLPSWSAQNVTVIGHVALYIIIPELFLGLSTYLVYEKFKDKNIAIRFLWAYVIMVFYLGNAALFNFLERVVLGF